jgi:hypothetical protein
VRGVCALSDAVGPRVDDQGVGDGVLKNGIHEEFAEDVGAREDPVVICFYIRLARFPKNG